MGKKKKQVKDTGKGGSQWDDYTDKNKYDKDWPPQAPLKKARGEILGPKEIYS